MDRLALLEQMIARTPDDPFPRYGRAMELRKLGRTEQALAAFGELVERHPDYVPAYLMYGNLLAQVGRTADAARIYDQGIAAATDAGDDHARSELADARAELL